MNMRFKSTIHSAKKAAWRAVMRRIRVRGFEDYVQQMIQRGDCHTVLDIGCGPVSGLSRFRPSIRMVGLDVFEQVLAEARAQGRYDDYVLADILKVSSEELLERFGGQPFDLVTLIDVIEHVPKRQGFELLEKCERLTCKYILIVTPNGFLEQGPEYGNEFQRHLSGWFAHDFEGMGYTVHGAVGCKALRGYAGGPRYNFLWVDKFNAVVAWLMRVEKKHHRAFSLIAIKDVRGVPARLGVGPR
jgi:SAM-dependent methyltransferase